MPVRTTVSWWRCEEFEPNQFESDERHAIELYGSLQLRNLSLQQRSNAAKDHEQLQNTMKLVCSKFLLLTTISVYLIALRASLIEASAYYQNNGQYNPEEQDGIPVFSARSVAKLEDDWTGNMRESMQPRPAATVQRRQADNDLDDGLEEDDDDEYKSGSSPRESIESPSYGESLRFAKDGDDIENFFDTHLGAPKEAAGLASDDSSEQPTIVRQEQVPAVDPDDEYEAAASGPLSTIFQSLLGHSQDGDKHTKRPFLQISTSSSSDPDAATKTDKAQNEPASGLRVSQSAQSSVEASSPITFSLRPAYGPGQESMNHESVVGADSYGGPNDLAQAPQSSGGLREIYIGRRPTVMSYLQQQQQQQPLQHLSGGYATSGSANIWRGPNGQPLVYEREQASDYSRYPVAASYAYQQQPSAAPSESTLGSQSNDDDDQTVTYGLSFGGGHAAEADESPSSASSDQESAEPASNSVDQQAQTYQNLPYNTPYTTSSTRALNNYYNNYYAGQQQQLPQGYVRAYPIGTHLRQKTGLPIQNGRRQRTIQQYYAKNRGPARFHRDPSESSNILAAIRNGDLANFGNVTCSRQNFE